MKIDQIDAVSLQVTGKTIWTFVRAKTRDGLTGHGEATLQGAAAAVEAGVLRRTAALQGLTPDAALKHIQDAALPQQITEAAAISGIEQALTDLVAVGDSPADFRRFVEGEIEKWTKVARAANVKLD